jgi:hypothetical protein
MIKYFLQSPKLIACIFATAILFSCKKNDVNKPVTVNAARVLPEKTVKDVVFSGEPDITRSIIQLSANGQRQRTLVPLRANNTALHKYLLIETQPGEKTRIQTYVIAKTQLTKTDNLFDIAFTSDGITAYEKTTEGNTGKRLLLKHGKKELSRNEKIGDAIRGSEILPNNPNPGDDNGGFCIDHWWVTYNVETGQILSVEYMGSDCYGCEATGTCGVGGGGGSGGNPGNVDSILAVNFINMANATTVDNTMKSVTLLWETPATRSRKYTWRCVKNPTGWNVFSEEHSVEERQPVGPGQSNPNLWYFKSLAHANVYKLGISVGGTTDVASHSGLCTYLGNINANMSVTTVLKFSIAGLNPFSWNNIYPSSIICSIYPYAGEPIITD